MPKIPRLLLVVSDKRVIAQPPPAQRAKLKAKPKNPPPPAGPEADLQREISKKGLPKGRAANMEMIRKLTTPPKK